MGGHPRERIFFKICEEQFEIYETKNKDYGDSFVKAIDRLGTISFLTRVYDKMERLIQLAENDPDVKNESFDDSVRDILNYCIMYLMYVKEEEGLAAPIPDVHHGVTAKNIMDLRLQQMTDCCAKQKKGN